MPLKLKEDKSLKTCNINNNLYRLYFFSLTKLHILLFRGGKNKYFVQQKEAGAQLMDLAALQSAFKAACSHILLKDVQNPIFLTH